MESLGAMSRIGILIKRLVHAGISREEATNWQITPTGHHARSKSKKYTYVHPHLPGQYTSLSRAKEAHIEAHARALALASGKHVCHNAGSNAAMSIIHNARWKNAGKGHAVSPDIANLLDVVVSTDTAERKVGPEPCDADWHAEALVEKHKYLIVSRSTLVVDREHCVLALFVVASPAWPELPAMVPLLHKLYDVMHDVMPDSKLRKGIRMFGYRYNKMGHFATGVGRACMCTGYYPAVTHAKAIRLRRDSLAKEAVVGVASTVCMLESRIAPAMARHRADHAAACNHPGIWPGTSHDICSASALGISRGYVSHPHVDLGFADMAETIVWSSKDVQTGSRYCFAVVDAGIVFDLLAAEATMCMVPGSVRHGTPRRKKGMECGDTGVGVVLLNKANLLSRAVLCETRELCDRVLHNTLNPFITGFSSTYRGVVCFKCRSSRRMQSMLLCDECNTGCHAECLGIPMPPEGGWTCPRCMPHM